MRLSALLAPTLRTAPSDARHVARILLLRGGYLRELGASGLAWLPLGWRVRQVLLTGWQSHTAHWHQQPCQVPLAPTGPNTPGASTLDTALRAVEPALVLLTHHTLRSWRYLPQHWSLQVQPTDEGFWISPATPAPVLCAVHHDEAALQRSMDTLRDGTQGLLKALGLAPALVHAGPTSAFSLVVESPLGTSPWLACHVCGYGANQDWATSQPGPMAAPPAGPALQDPQPFATPGVHTIRDLESSPYLVPATRQLKTLVYLADGAPVIAVVRGDRDLSLAKFRALLGCEVLEPAPAPAVQVFLGALPGSLGAVGTEGKPLWVDAELEGAQDMVTGANQDGFHLRGVAVERHLAHGQRADLRLATTDDGCPCCGAPLTLHQGLELFTTRRAQVGGEAPSALGPEGKELPLHLALATFSPDRVMAAVVESHHDDDGIRWPAAIAPFQVSLLNLQAKSPDVTKACEALYTSLCDTGFNVLYDDRDERAGVKFKDADLLGAPLRLSVGGRSLAAGAVEWKLRGADAQEQVPMDTLMARVEAALCAASAPPTP